MDESLIRNLSFAMHIMLSLGIELAIPLLADPEMAVSTSSRPPPDVNVTHLGFPINRQGVMTEKRIKERKN